MKTLFRVLVPFLLVGRLVAPPAVSKANLERTFKLLEFDIPIRVLLEEKKLTNLKWSLSSNGGFVAYSPHNKRKTIFKGTTLLVTYRNGAFHINGQKMPDTHMFILPLAGLLRKGAVPYDGVFSLTKVRDTAYLVNHLDLEEYLQAVLPYESIPGWPDEVQKAFCIAFRSYGISKILEQRALHARSKWPYPYDIKSTNAHQVYRGHEKSACFKKIVNDTRGIVLAHNKKPILAMFDTACGGVIPARKKGVHFDKAPYLERKYPCHYCKDHRFYRWENSYSFDELEQGLKKLFPNLGKLREIKVGAYDGAGVAQTIRVRGSSRWFKIRASKFKSLFPNIRSLCFNLTRNGSKIVVSGKGFGHHLGLCQWGAYFMVKKGWDHKKVLAFYYPNTYFMKLTRLP